VNGVANSLVSSLIPGRNIILNVPNLLYMKSIFAVPGNIKDEKDISKNTLVLSTFLSPVLVMIMSL
jgi:hypothetical protein